MITKLQLTQTHPESLKIWFMIARQVNLEIANEKVVAVLAYNLEDALVKAKEEAQGLNLTYRGQSIPVQELIEKLYLDNIVSPPPQKPEKLRDKKQLNKEQFKAGLLLTAEELVKSKVDKKILQRIIKKL